MVERNLSSEGLSILIMIVVTKALSARKLSLAVGPGLATARIGDKMLVSDLAKKPDFAGAFFVKGYFVNEEKFRCTVGLGFVNGIEPTINGIPISGVDEDGWPLPGGVPALEGADYGGGGISYIVLELRIDSDGQLNEDIQVKISAAIGGSGETWLHPLAAFRRDGEIYQMAYFDFTYQAVKISSYSASGLLGGDGEWAHLILPNLGENFYDNRIRPSPPFPPVNYALRRWV